MRWIAVILAVAVSACAVWVVLGAARFSMNGDDRSLSDLPAGFWLLIVIGVASFLLLTVGLLLRRR